MNITPGYFVSLPHEQALSTTLYIHYGISCALNAVALYCLLRKTPDYMPSVRSYLLLIQTTMMLNDLVGDVLVQFVVLTPAVGFYCFGVVCRDGIPVNVPLALFVALGCLVAVGITMCFVFKHQTVVPETSLFKLNKLFYKLLHVGAWSACPVGFIVLLVIPMDYNVSDRAMNTYPFHLQWIRDRGSYYVYEKTDHIRVAGVIMIAGLAIWLLISNLIVWHVYYILNQILIVPSIFLCVPIIATTIATVADFGNIDMGQVATHILLLHTPIHSIILLAITPVYRTFLRSCQLTSEKIPAASVASVTLGHSRGIAISERK
ncbi:hypothetical protein PRIPAC_89413 [Pristionchus pacificus]|uniref:G protein-coupled receptor n=1 Tax=Pristionchus pacificus TaxID=54126 RepID=A0A2A6CWB7_PRIPA|nr:hypothetical protein PRIPAC_89413 [Pristionchus pacificus]|eukprot:PDM82485.1 G protein-coupled receptor [Pristionchus pacificus]